MNRAPHTLRTTAKWLAMGLPNLPMRDRDGGDVVHPAPFVPRTAGTEKTYPYAEAEVGPEESVTVLLLRHGNRISPYCRAGDRSRG